MTAATDNTRKNGDGCVPSYSTLFTKMGGCHIWPAGQSLPIPEVRLRFRSGSIDVRAAINRYFNISTTSHSILSFLFIKIPI